MATMLEIEELPIRLTADGRWLHGDTPMHPKVARLFARCLVPEPEGGWHLEVGVERAPVEVADTGLFVERMVLDESDGALTGVRLVLSDGAEEPLDPAALESSAETHVLYCRTLRHGLSVPCRFPPALYHRLALFMEPRGEGFVLPLGGRDHPVRPYRPGPQRSDQ